MKEVFPFDHPKIIELQEKLFNTLFNESLRGALLVATTYTDDFLTDLLKSIIPAEVSKKEKERLFKYPGVLSSFYSKIELSYMLRIIDKSLYSSLHALREIRNDAAHEIKIKDIEGLNLQLKKVFDLGNGVAEFLREVAVKTSITLRVNKVSELLKETEWPEQQKDEFIRNSFKEEKAMKAIDHDVPYITIFGGLCLLCFSLVTIQEKVEKQATKFTIWPNLLENEEIQLH